jgi:hypothetical protein
MPKWVKLIVGILLLPICVGTAKSVWNALAQAGPMTQVWMPFLAGAACWVVVFLLLPKPMWIYVFGHELTHAVWTWAFGGSVKRFKAGSSGGHVLTTKNNFIIALAPYFFPFYAVVVVVVFLIGELLANWRVYLPWFHLLLGAAYAFHVTLTIEILKTRQTDITSQGWLFSAVIIFLGNALVLAIGVPMLTGHGLLLALSWWFQANATVLHRLAHLI